ncbi:superoxide dismutase [Ni] [Luteolibacter sp. AS25]|uniref:superoxide dismutase [Ni] n=1 Tax=Luteolibacter sp. AS25 TaxID=3135776 RepID=UPI00398B16D4
MKNSFLLAAALVFAVPATVSAHCQVPCGIYDDDNVIQSMHTDWVTIEKASKQIIELSKDPAANAHQLTRWIMNKESHCQDLQEKILNYFLAQRLALPEDDAAKEAYTKKLTLCHEIIVTTMKCKQSTDAANVDKLHDLLHTFQGEFGSKE